MLLLLLINPSCSYLTSSLRSLLPVGARDGDRLGRGHLRPGLRQDLLLVHAYHGGYLIFSLLLI